MRATTSTSFVIRTLVSVFLDRRQSIDSFENIFICSLIALHVEDMVCTLKLMNSVSENMKVTFPSRIRIHSLWSLCWIYILESKLFIQAKYSVPSAQLEIARNLYIV